MNSSLLICINIEGGICLGQSLRLLFSHFLIICYIELGKLLVMKNNMKSSPYVCLVKKLPIL